MLLDTRYADTKRVTLVQDNLNTCTKTVFYEVFEPPTARANVRRISGVFPPKYGSWPDVAGCAMTRQRLTGRRVRELSERYAEITPWADHTNAKQRGVDWQLQVDEARIKLARLCPKIMTG